jgi:hypothetical protein
MVTIPTQSEIFVSAIVACQELFLVRRARLEFNLLGIRGFMYSFGNRDAPPHPNKKLGLVVVGVK